MFIFMFIVSGLVALSGVTVGYQECKAQGFEGAIKTEISCQTAQTHNPREYFSISEFDQCKKQDFKGHITRDFQCHGVKKLYKYDKDNK